MSNIAIKGATTGTGVFTLESPATNTDRTLVLPDEAGTLVTTASLPNPLTSGTTVATTSGTAIDFTGIPSWVKRITVMFAGVSINSTSVPIIQLGDSGGIESSGYLGAAVRQGGTTTVNGAAYTTGFGTSFDWGAATTFHGVMTLTLLNSSTNLWACSFTGAWSDQAYVLNSGGSKTLSGVLDRVRLTTVNGTDTFDAGSINIMYE